MGIFNKKTEDAKEVKKPVAKKASVKKTEEKSIVKTSPKSSKGVPTELAGVIRNPRITEKAAHISDQNVYTFDVAPGAGKIEIAKAVKAIYNLTPVKVNVSAIPTKRVFRATHIGVKRGGRKAYVFLKKGDKIEFI